MVNNFFSMHRVSMREREFDPICIATFGSSRIAIK